MSTSLDEYTNREPIAWCPGCGNFAILDCLKKALVELELPPHRVIVVTGIGQAAKLPHYMNVNTFNGLHGREVASATAVKLAANDMTVVVHAGDGGCYGEGGNHLLHAIRRNIDISLIVHDNHYYGLTKGQVSPTSPRGTVTSVHTRGVSLTPLNPMTLAISQECGFVAQGSAAHKEHLIDLMKRAVRHRGFSLVNVLQPCVTYDKIYTYQYYKDHCRIVDGNHDPTDFEASMRLARKGNYEGEIPIGLIYKKERPTLDEALLQGHEKPLRDRETDPQKTKELFDLFR